MPANVFFFAASDLKVGHIAKYHLIFSTVAHQFLLLEMVV